MSFFAEQKDKYKVYAVGEKQCMVSDADMLVLREKNIVFLSSIMSYSISKPYKTYETIRWLNNKIIELKIDFVHVFVPTPFSLWLFHVKIPYVITTRGTDVLITLPDLYNKRKKSLKSFVIFLMFKSIFRKAFFITSTSYPQIDSIKGLFNVDNTALIRTGVDVESISQIKDYSKVENVLKNKQFIFSPRHVNNPIYNAELQLSSIKLLSKQIIDNYTFVFINKNGMNRDYLTLIEEKLKALSSEIGLSYLLIERLSQSHLWQFYKKASLTIMTPVSDGTPNTALEAMAAKCPLIIPNLPYDSDLFNGTCLKMYSNSPECLAELIEQAIFAYPDDLISEGYKKVSYLGNRCVEMKKLENIYLSIINKN